MSHATLLALVCLAVCHGRPLLTSTVSTVSDGTVSSRYHFPTPPSSLLLAGTPLNTVTTTSEDPPTIATPEESSTVAHSTTVTPSTVERLSDLHDPFDIKNCMDGDTICYFLPRCFSSDFDASTDLWLVTVTRPLLDKFDLKNCAVVAIVKNGQLELRRPLPLLNEKFTLREYGLTIDNEQVQCTDCAMYLTDELDKVRTDTLNLPRRMTTKISSKRSSSASSTTEPLHHATTTKPPNHSTTPSTTTTSYATTTTPQKRSTKLPPLPLPHTPSLVTDPAGILDRDADDVTAATSELKESGWGLAVIILLVIIVIIVLALIISIYRTQHRQQVRPAASPVAKIPPAWSSKRGSSASLSAVSNVYEWPINMPIERSTDMTEDEDYDERTPLAPNSVRSCARTVDSASRTPLVQPAVPESSGPDFSAKPPTPARESCATIEVSVTPSKDKQIKSTKPESKRPLLEKAKALFKHTPRTPLMEKTAQPPSNTLEEVSM